MALCCSTPATGINAVVYYGPQIFSLAGISSDKSAIFATLLVAITNVLATVIALVLVDRLGRKPLLYAGIGGMTISLFVLALCFHNQAALGSVAGHHCHGLPDVFTSHATPSAWGRSHGYWSRRYFPCGCAAAGVAAATLSFGTSNFLVSLTFLSLIKAAGNSLTFAIFGTVLHPDPRLCAFCHSRDRRA